MHPGQYFYATKARVSNPGDLSPFIDRFADELAEQGYSTRSVEKHVQSVAHFGEWLQMEDTVVEGINNDVISRFGRHRCICPSRRVRKPISDRDTGRLHRFVRCLRRQGVLPGLTETESDIDAEPLHAFGNWLCNCRGLSPASVVTLKRGVTELLPLLGNDPDRYEVATVRQVVQSVARECGRSKVKTLCNSLRSYLRFLVASGRCTPELVGAVPTVPSWRLSSLPRYITTAEVERVLDVWSGSDPRSLRNRAMVLLLADLGLRARDILTLCIDDINWHDATFHVRGKSRRPSRLPLPQRVGDALLVYLEAARPPLATPEVFLRLRPPCGPLRSSAAVSGIVDVSLTLAGIEDPPARGAHLLRHSAATAMLRNGATLDEVSAILRHRSIDMTAHYAKVDVEQLQQITQPWPERAQC